MGAGPATRVEARNAEADDLRLDANLEPVEHRIARSRGRILDRQAGEFRQPLEGAQKFLQSHGISRDRSVDAFPGEQDRSLQRQLASHAIELVAQPRGIEEAHELVERDDAGHARPPPSHGGDMGALPKRERHSASV
jgi:hypothetical protein